MNSQFCRCSDVARKSRGYHTNGTYNLRPSVSDTPSSSSVTSTLRARGSAASTEVVIPCLHELPLTRPHDAPNLVEHLDAEAEGLQLLDEHLEGLGHARL